MLLLLHAARESARIAQRGGAAENALAPEAFADELLDEIRLLGGAHRGSLFAHLVGMALDEVQAALYEHVAVPARWAHGRRFRAPCSRQPKASPSRSPPWSRTWWTPVTAISAPRRTRTRADTVASMDRVIDMMRLAVAPSCGRRHASGLISGGKLGAPAATGESAGPFGVGFPEKLSVVAPTSHDPQPQRREHLLDHPRSCAASVHSPESSAAGDAMRRRGNT